MLVEGLIALVLLAFASGNGTTDPKKYCLSEDPKPYDQFSTKTSYFKIQTTPLETLPLIDKGQSRMSRSGEDGQPALIVV